MALRPPPNKTYPTQDEAMKDIQAVAMGQGYGIAIKRSKTDKVKDFPTVCKVWLRCSYGRRYKSTAEQRSNAGSRMTDCGFAAILTRTADSWFFEVTNPEHNHSTMHSNYGLPVHRKRDNETINQIHAFATYRTKPAAVYSELLAQGKNVDNTNIYNKRAIFKQKQMGGLIPIQALL